MAIITNSSQNVRYEPTVDLQIGSYGSNADHGRQNTDEETQRILKTKDVCTWDILRNDHSFI